MPTVATLLVVGCGHCHITGGALQLARHRVSVYLLRGGTFLFESDSAADAGGVEVVACSTSMATRSSGSADMVFDQDGCGLNLNSDFLK